jgi:hypothetical protein
VIARVARTTALACGAIAMLFAWWRADVRAAIAVLGGGALIGFAFWAIAATVDDLILRFRDETGRKTAGFALVKFFTRHAIVAVAAYGMMVRLHLDGMGLLAGVSSLGVAAAVEAIRDLRWRRFL